jgi:sulfate permease, SulP family
VATILRTGLTSRIAVVTTFAATLFLPVAAAVGIGVALSLLLQLNTEAMDLKVVELLPREDGRFEERRAPSALTSDHVTILDVYGSLLYAGTRTLQARLPDPAGAEAPVVILRLRGRTSLGSTFIKLVGDYAERLDDVGGRLYLSGLQSSLTEQLHRTGSMRDRYAPSKRPRWSVNRPRRPTLTLRPGWYDGTTRKLQPDSVLARPGALVARRPRSWDPD